ncbi:hypothetical protein KIW84_057254 [Lathyrus oleraceus]|uniref:Uncharacterized protein n=1 Tax=Pisum sativum TaxID=3888 RepID=A0A9D4X5E2_PEA|nr:hypothetical protein KIW84_057254 [Pisum sativum]
MHGDGKQHYFNGCAPVFEVIVFRRIKPLQPRPNPDFAYLPIESYMSKRTDWKALEMLEASELTESTVLAFSAIIEGQSLEPNVVALCGQFILSGLGCALPESIEPKFSAAEDPHPKRRCLEGDASPSPSSSIPANVAKDFLASEAEDDSASSLKGVHDCLAEDNLASSLVDDVVSLCLNDAYTHPFSPVNDAFAAQPSSAPPPPPPEIGLRRSSRARKENVKYSPSFSKNKKK